MDESSVKDYIQQTFANVETTDALTYTFFFYGSERMLPFMTIATADNEHDRISNLDRPGVYRLNLGVRRPTFESLFGKGDIDISAYDYTALDTLMPHPEYSAQSFFCVLNPSDATFERIKPLLAEAYELAVWRANRRRDA